MKSLVLLLAVFVSQEIPLKPKEGFEVKLDYQFRPRPVADVNTVQLGKHPDRRAGSTVLPYLILNVKILEVEEEKMRVRISNNLDSRPMQKKVAAGTDIVLDLGFTDDMKDRVTAHEYTLIFVDEHKEPVNRIVIDVQEDGRFLVNGEIRGKF